MRIHYGHRILGFPPNIRRECSRRKCPWERNGTYSPEYGRSNYSIRELFKSLARGGFEKRRNSIRGRARLKQRRTCARNLLLIRPGP